jgi:general secretion pathway protein C
MLARRRLRLALEIGLAALAVALAAYGVSLGLAAAASGTLPPESLAAAPPAQVGRPLGPLETYAVIAGRDVFNPATAPDDRGVADGLRLWGVGVHGTQARAVIEDRETHRQELYRVGQQVHGARIVAIGWDRVTLERGGVESTLELTPPGERRTEGVPSQSGGQPAEPTPPAARIRRTGADAFIVDRRELEGVVDNMSGLMTQLRAVAEVAEGRPSGFRLFQIKEDSIFRRLGLQDGDVVQRVNGTVVSDPTSLLAFLERLRSEPRVAVDIVRDGGTRTLVYDLR